MNKTILVVSEDSEFINSLRVLLKSGYRFLEAHDIEVCKTKIDSEKVSMVIIDVKLSEEVVPTIYKEYINALVEKDILVHLLIEEEETREAAHLIEISDEFLVKPIKVDKLLSNIESLLHLKEIEEKILKQCEKLNLLENGLINERSKIKYEVKLIDNLLDFMLEMKEKMHRKNMELEENEERLKRASREWRITFDSISDLIILFDSEMKIIKANLATARFLHKPIKEIIGKTCYQLFHGADKPPAVCPFVRMKKTNKYEYAELYLSEKDIWIRVSVDPIFDDEGNLSGSVHVIRDITENKRIEERLHYYQGQLRSLASQLLLLEEQERRRIATDLHDHIGQTLALCKIKLGTLRESISSNLIKSMDEVRNLLEQTIKYTRSLTFELSSPILYELSFEAAVERLGEQILKKHGILFDFENDGQIKMIEEEARILLFQAIRELLVNIVKHSKAHNVSIFIRREGDSIRINVEDDGIGFDVSKINYYQGRNDGFGLFSIRERLNYIGGYLTIDSEPEHGTKIMIVAPLSLENIGK